MIQPIHIPVMAKEVFAFLALKPGDTYVDGTVGLAGHAEIAASAVAPDGLIVALDWDADMLARARERLLAIPGVIAEFFHCDYREIPASLDQACRRHKKEKAKAKGILLDLGVNNAHLETPERGFSFRMDGPLDMRMNRSRGETASSFLNRATPAEIEWVLWTYGDEKWARRIAQVIVDRRPLSTMNDFVNCILAAVPPAKRDKNIHPATRSSQAVRIHINGELDRLEEAISAIAECLDEHGVLVVLSYHSGEDRAVKSAFRKLASGGEFTDLARKPILPSQEEINANPKARSAKLRAIQKTPRSQPQ